MSDEVLTRLIDERNAEIARLKAENAKLVTVLNGYIRDCKCQGAIYLCVMCKRTKAAIAAAETA